MARVSIVGLGYVGCVTAACLAKAGHEVVGVDADPGKVERVAREIGRALRGRDVPFTVVLRSTVLPGTTERVLLPALRPGFAFGGSCLPKDLRALLHAGRAADVSPPLLGSILPSNEAQVRRAVEAVLETRRRRVGVVGLSFKPGTDDLRESPMVALVEALIGKGCDLRVLDRNVSIARLVGANRRYIEEEIPHIASLMCESLEALLQHAEVVVIGAAGPEAEAALAAVGPRHIVVDLAQGGFRSLSARGAGVLA